MFFEQVAEVHDADSVRDALDTEAIRKLAVKLGLEHCALSMIRLLSEPMLQEMNAASSLVETTGDRSPQEVRAAQSTKANRPRNHRIYFVQEHRFARALRDQVRAKFLLGYENTAPVAPCSRYPGSPGF